MLVVNPYYLLPNFMIHLYCVGNFPKFKQIKYVDFFMNIKGIHKMLYLNWLVYA